MPTYQIASGLPALPNGLDDKEAALVKPLYLSMNALARRVSEATARISYSQTEMEQLSQLLSLMSSRFQTVYALAAEDLIYGTLVNLYIDAGKIKARKADATISNRAAHGIVDQPTGITTGQYGPIVFMIGRCAGVAGAVFGAQYYLGAAGALQLIAPAGDTDLKQPVAIGLGSAGVFLMIPAVVSFGSGGGSGGGYTGPTITVSDTAPTSPAEGDIWIDTSEP